MNTVIAPFLHEFPLCEFSTLSAALCTWAVESEGIESGEITHGEACTVVERNYPGGWHKFRHDWEKARRVGEFARERLSSVGLVDAGEEKRGYQELDVSGLVRDVDRERMKGAGRVRHQRARRCYELRARRAAWALVRELGLLPREVHFAYSPSGRWFHSSTEIVGVSGSRVLLEVVSALDC